MWLTSALLQAAGDVPENLEGHVLGRGLPQSLMREMQVGIWSAQESPAPDALFRKRNGVRGEFRKGWMTIPYWGPRGRLVGVEFRTWGTEGKEVRDFRLPEARWIPTFIGLVPSTLQKIWTGGDVWLVEGVFDVSLTHVVPDRDVVLGCGTARVSNNQLNFLRRFLSPNAVVHVAFDEDATGRRQVEGYIDDTTEKRVPGVLERLLRVGLRGRDVRYRGGKDPGQIWENGGRVALRTSFHLR